MPESSTLIAPRPSTAATTTLQLARGSQTVAWRAGDITLFEGSVAEYGSVRIAVTAWMETGGMEIKVAEVTDPTMPIIIESSVSEQNYQELRTVLMTPGRRLRVYVWMDECPSHEIQLTWGVWGRAS
jgi:hypothetical protein